MMSRIELLFSLPAQDLDDIERIEEAVDVSSLTGQDIAVAGIIFLASCVIAWASGLITRRFLRRYTTAPDYVDQLAGRLVSSLIVFIGFASALERLGVDVGWFAVIVALVGVVIVLMIRPLVENGASGLLLTTRPAFSVGDQIETNSYSGEVITINGRSTVIKTPDQRRVHIPNNDVLDQPIVVYTAYEARRSELDIEVAYDADPDTVRRVLVETLGRVEGVVDDPSPSIRARGFGAGTVILRLGWWHDGDLGSDAATLDRVVWNVKAVLDGEGIDMPSPEVIVRRVEPADIEGT